jgi:dTDP-4-dehydrorhamnose reductase
MAKERPILITGANGLVGSRLLARLAAEGGHDVLAVGRGVLRSPAPPRVRYVELDLLSPDALQALIEREEPAAILHAAAMTDVDACERDPASARLVNERAAAAAAAGAQRVSARLVALSTDYVFDGEAGPYGEEARPNARGVYAVTKLAGERAVQELLPAASIARVAVIFSGRPGAKKTFASAAADAFAHGKEVKAFHDQVVSPTLADNAAEMVLGVLRKGGPGIFHCSGATALSRVDFCLRLARKMGADERLVVPVALADLRLPAPRPLRCALKVDKVKQLLGEGMPLDIDAALDRFLEERREGGWR